MDQQYSFHPQSQKHNKKRLTDDQVKLLERSFTANKKLEPETKLRLAKELGVPPRQVAIWYQNKRARWRTQSLEFDYGALQVKLESVMAEKRKVEKEVEKLRGELKRAQEMLAAMNTTCSTSNSYDGDDGVLQLEELYACFLDVDRASRWG